MQLSSQIEARGTKNPMPAILTGGIDHATAA